MARSEGTRLFQTAWAANPCRAHRPSGKEFENRVRSLRVIPFKLFHERRPAAIVSIDSEGYFRPSVLVKTNNDQAGVGNL